MREHEKVHLHLSSSIKSVEGYVGNFKVTIDENEKEKTLNVGSIIVATGAVEMEPEGLYEYDGERVITQLQLEEKLRGGDFGAGNVVMIQCAGARGEVVDHCSKICCVNAIKNAKLIRQKGANVFIAHNELQAYGEEYELYYKNAREAGVRFLRFPLDRRPKVLKENGKLEVNVFHERMQRDIPLKADLVVLSTPMVQTPEAEPLSKMLKVPLGGDKFFFEAHVKLRPVDFTTDGVFLCGTAHGPKDISESIIQGYATASKASILLARGYVKSEAITSFVDGRLCIGCFSCEAVCPFDAIHVMERENKAETNPMLCKGCGTCSAECPTGAITMRHFADYQIEPMIDAALAEKWPADEPKIVAFSCNWCYYAGADLAGVSRFQYPPNIRIIQTMCSGRVDTRFILKALGAGADGVLVGGCHIGDCYYISGNEYAERRIKRLKHLMESAGIDPRRLRLEWVSASEGRRFADIVT